MAREVVVLSGVRTAIGDYGGGLRDMAPTALGAAVIREAVSRAKIEPGAVGHLVLGSVIHGEARDVYISRVAGIEGGLPIVIDGVCVGAVGVGSGTGAQDVEVARAALAALGAEDQVP